MISPRALGRVRSPRSLVLGTALAALASTAHGQIEVGPWSFDEDAFADGATQIDTGTLSLYCGASSLTDALTGHSPDRLIVNTGHGSNANHFQLDFLDLKAQNAPGPDLVFFVTRFSADPYEITVRATGGEFEPFRTYAATDFLDLGIPSGCGGILFGLEVDLGDFGLPLGTTADAMQFRSLPKTAGGLTSEGDPTMAAVLNGFEQGLIGTPASVSLALGGVQTLTLDGGAAHAGLPYLLLGSLSGTDPGFPLDDKTLPLNIDAYTFFTLFTPNTATLSDSLGTLDAVGKATSLLTIPPGLSPTFAGTKVNHAFVLIELLPTLLHIPFISQPVELELIP